MINVALDVSKGLSHFVIIQNCQGPCNYVIKGMRIFF